MYQFSTFAPLAKSKSYVKSLAEAKEILKKVISETNKYRKKNDQEELEGHEIESGQRLLKLDLALNPDVMSILAPEQNITLDNLDSKLMKIIGEK